MPTYIDYRNELTIHQSGRLPHWNISNGVYFVTFRLAGSLPVAAKARLKREYAHRLRKLERVDDSEERTRRRDEMRRDFFETDFDPLLDQGHGDLLLARPQFAEVVQNALLHFDGHRYLLVAWCIMGNHVHVVFLRHPDHPLEKVLHSWKSYTGHILKRKAGLPEDRPFWQANYWDRLVRTMEELDSVIQYTIDNPRRAGMRDWPWWGYHPDALRTQWPPEE